VKKKAKFLFTETSELNKFSTFTKSSEFRVYTRNIIKFFVHRCYNLHYARRLLILKRKNMTTSKISESNKMSKFLFSIERNGQSALGFNKNTQIKSVLNLLSIDTYEKHAKVYLLIISNNFETKVSIGKVLLKSIRHQV